MIRLIIIFIIVFLSPIKLSLANENVTLNAGISMIDKVPDNFFGTWRVKSKIISTNNSKVFKESTVDIWNLSRTDDVLTLENPFTGARASVVLKEVNNSVIKFKKSGDYDGKILSDVVQLELSDNNSESDNFSGKNYLTLKTLSNVDNSVIKVDEAVYVLEGKKISGQSIR